VGKETVVPSWTFAGGESTLVGVFTLIGVESYTVVESSLHSVAFVSVRMRVYVTTVSQLPFAIAEGFGITVMIGVLCGSAVLICLVGILFLDVRRISKASEMELFAGKAIGPDSIANLTSGVCKGLTRSELRRFTALADGQPFEPRDSQSPFSSSHPEDLPFFLF
jgi:hypothetical protein